MNWEHYRLVERFERLDKKVAELETLLLRLISLVEKPKDTVHAAEVSSVQR